MNIEITNRISIFAIVLMLLVGCSVKSTTIDDLYIEAWTALEAYKHGNYIYNPADKNITITTNKYETDFKISATAVVKNRKTALRLTYPNVCLFNNDQCLRSANKEFVALNKCVNKAVSGLPFTDSCSSSSFTINGKKILMVKDSLNSPHMDVWIYNVD